MPLAAPLILPFAELAGITIAGLGMAAASKKVSDFISDNPEISTQILTTLVPGGVGLNALFKDKDAPSTKDIVLGELGKEKGNYSDPDAEGAYSSKRGRIIKALEEAGKIKKGPDKDYDPDKKYKDYKKFYEKADGGAIGVEALFTDKKPRKNFSTGGDEQRKIADDEYYASLQNIIERDPGAKEFFNPDDITYPAMDKSGNYNYKGIQVGFKDLDRFKKYAEKRGLDQILSSESTFEEKIKEGQYPVGIFERPVETGTEPMDLRKMQTILHEARHKIMMKPEFRKIMDKYLLKEETFVRYLDKEFFPELDAYLPDFVNPEEADKTYKKAVEEYKDKFTKEDKGFINRLKNLFADGGAIGIEVLFEEKKDGGRIGFANGGDNIINKDLISLFRGQPMFGQTTNQALSSYPSEKMLSGKFFSPDLDLAKNYAKNSSFPSVVKEMKVPSNVLDKAYNFKNRLQTLPSKTFEMINMNPKVVIANKNMLKNYKPSINIPATLSSNFSQGIGFLKNNAMKGLAYASSLPFQTALATLYPTPANASEVNMNPEDFAALNARTNIQGIDLEMDPGARINPDIQPQQNIFQRAGDVFSSIKDNIPNFGIMGLLSNLDRFDTLSPEDQAFILDQAGGNRPSKDPFGINRRSAFGNYADYVRNQGILAPGKRGEYYRSLNIPGLDTAMKETVAREQIAKRAYEKQIRDAADAASRNAARARSITAGYGGSDDSRGATGPTASGAGMGVGGGYASDYGFAKGGLATMFVEKR